MGLLVGNTFVERRPASGGRALLVVGMLASVGLETGAGADPAINLSTVAAGTGGFVINGSSPNYEFGDAVSAGGDVDGDGLADIFVGARFSSFTDTYSGQGFMISGKASTAAVPTSSLSLGYGSAWARASRSVQALRYPLMIISHS